MRLAIIGAGMAGLAAGRWLREHAPGVQVTVYEKSRGFGGRVATRRRDGFVFDHGAQCVKGPTPAVTRLLTEVLPADALVRLEKPIWTFDGSGALTEGDAGQNAEANYAYADGNNRLGKLLADGLDVRREVRVGSLRRRAHDEAPVTNDNALPSTVNGPLPGRSTVYEVLDIEGNLLGEADAVLMTAPAQQTADILAASELDVPDLLAELGRASYRRCLSVALAYSRPLERPFYALVNTDRKHPLAWLGLEHTKGTGRCPAGHSLLIAQMAPQWSLDYYAEPVETLAPQVVAMVEALLDEPLGAPLWADLQRWRYALPDTSSSFEALNQAGTAHRLFFAGDYTCDKGRVHLSIERGWQAAELIAGAAGVNVLSDR